MTITTLLLDAHGVIYDLDFEEVYSGVAKHFGIVERGQEVSDYFDTFLQRLLVDAISFDEVCKAVSEKFNIHGDISAIVVSEYLKRLQKNELFFEYVRSHKDTYTFAILTSNTIIRDQADEQINLYNDFDYVYKSFELKMKKPDPAFFQHALTDMKKTPEETLFLDDNPQNVSAARTMGMEGIVVENFEQMRRDLGQYGIVY